jgi:hypothetical protein
MRGMLRGSCDLAAARDESWNPSQILIVRGLDPERYDDWH